MIYTYSLWMSFIVYILVIITMIMHSYIAIKYTDKFEALLPNCAGTQYNKKALELSGFAGKMMRMTLISALLTTPSIYIKNGAADSEDIKNFPPHYRKLLVTLTLTDLLLVSLFVLLWLVGKLTNPS